MARPLKEKAPLTRFFAFKTTEEAGKVWDAKIAASKLSKSEFIRWGRDCEPVAAILGGFDTHHVALSQHLEGCEATVDEAVVTV